MKSGMNAQSVLEAAAILADLLRPPQASHMIIADHLDRILKSQRKGIATALRMVAKNKFEGDNLNKVFEWASLIERGLEVELTEDEARQDAKANGKREKVKA